MSRIEDSIKILCRARSQLVGESKDEMFSRFQAKYGPDWNNHLPEAHLGLVLEQNKVIMELQKRVSRLEGSVRS